MSTYNVVRNGKDDFDPMPQILDAVFDGEMDANDPRVVELLRTDAAAARRFRETQRVVDRLQRRPIAPDLSESILAVVHAKQPYTVKRKRARVTPQRVAFAGGLLAGIALVVLLQNVAKPPQRVAPVDVAQNVVTPEEIASGSWSSSGESVIAVKPRAPLAFHDTSKHEASFGTSPVSVTLAGSSGGVDLTGRTAVSTSVFASTAYAAGSIASVADDDCVDDASVGPAILASAPNADATAGRATTTNYTPGKEWPPADINAFIEHISVCGVSDEYRAAVRSN